MKRTALARRVALSPGRRKRKAMVPPMTRMLASSRSNGLCIVCGDPGEQLHHTWDEALFPELATTPDNLVLVCIPCHARHTSAFRRIPRLALPAATLALATGDGRRLAHLDRCYPA